LPDAMNEAAARNLVLERFADEEIRLCMVDAEPEGDPKKTEALIEALFELAARLPALGGCRPTPPLSSRLHSPLSFPIITASVSRLPH